MIFSVTYDPNSRFVCSTSDDRTIRLWKVTESKNSGSSNVNWHTATVVLTKTMFAHTARVWRAVIRDDIVVTIGEVRLEPYEEIIRFLFVVLIFYRCSRIRLYASGRSRVIYLIKSTLITVHLYGVSIYLRTMKLYSRVELMDLCTRGHPHATIVQKFLCPATTRIIFLNTYPT